MQYILIPAVILIWGLIIFRIIVGSGGKELPSEPNFITHNNASKDTSVFRLLENYPDPFLGYTPVTTNTTPVKLDKPLKNPATQNKNMNEYFSQLQLKYGGIIAGDNNTRILGLFKIKGKNFLFQDGSTFEELTVIKLFKDSAWVGYEELRKTINKNN